MPSYDPNTATLTLKFVYYGATGVGKSTSLQLLAKRLGGELLSLDTISQQTLFFDRLTLTLGLPGRRLLLRLYSVPGELMHLHTRKVLLRGADGVVLVGDPPTADDPSTLEMLRELHRLLRESGIQPVELPLVWQPRPFGPTPDGLVLAALSQLLEAAWALAEQLAARWAVAPLPATCVLSALRQLLELPRLHGRVAEIGPRSSALPRAADLQSQPRPLGDRELAKSARGTS
jgi:hypothetical protein